MREASAVSEPARRPPLPFPAKPPPGPFRRDFWRSPLRGPWLASFLSSALLPLIVICAITGFISHAAYDPDLGQNAIVGPGGIGFDLYGFNWPTNPAWLYAFTQGLHVVAGVAAIPILLAKLWAVIPQFFEWPPVRSVAHMVDRLGLALLVGGSVFVFLTGVQNIGLWYPWPFNFVPAHYYAAFVFLGALALHVATKLPTVRRSFRERGVIAPLREDLQHTRPEPPSTEPPGEHSSAPTSPAAPTISRRGLLATVGAGSAAVGIIAAGQAIGGPFRSLAVLAPHGPGQGTGPNDFQINKTAASVGIGPADVGPSWQLTVRGASEMALSREDLLRLAQSTQSLPIACVEGWSTTQDWTGVPLAELARLVGAEGSDSLFVESLQQSGAFNQTTLNAGQIADPRSLLALKVNGADLSLDHGFPARLIVPALPGVHNTKWVDTMTFRTA